MKTHRTLFFGLLITSAALAQSINVTPTGVGIGTATPGSKAEIANQDSPYHLYLSGNAPSLYFGPTSGTFPNASSNLVAAFIGFSTFNGSYGQGLGDLNIATQSRGGGNSSGINFMVPADDSGSYFQAMRISRNGRVGVGTATPQAGLDVYNGIHVHGGPSYAVTGAGLELLKINDSLGTISMVNGPDRSLRELRFYGKPLVFYTSMEAARFSDSGNMGIGTTNPTHKLTVNGEVKSRGFITDTSNWADYVFAPDYKLPSLTEVESHIKANGHLPDVPSGAEIVSQGLDLGKMSATQMAQIEQLMLHVIALNKKVQAQAELMDQQAKQIQVQAVEIENIKVYGSRPSLYLK